MIFKKLVASACILLLSQSGMAMTLVEKDYICPVGGESFTQTTPASGTSFGKRTDLKPIGPISAPWTIPQCPTNKFVMFKDDFSAEELQTYKKIVESSDYKAIAKDSSEYYYLAKLFEKSGKNNQDIAWAYLQASWEMEGDEARKNALNYFNESLSTISAKDKNAEDELINTNLIVGELNRLLGNFKEAKEHFETLKRDQDYASKPHIVDYINLELKLIDEGNANPEVIGKP